MSNESAGITVNVKIKTHIRQDDKTEDFYFDEVGQLFKMGETIYIRYQENSNEGVIPVTMKLVSDKTIQLRRHAKNDLRMVFDTKRQQTTKYKTPAGLFDITTQTNFLDFKYELEPTKGNVAIDYLLITGGEVVGEYKIRLQFAQ